MSLPDETPLVEAKLWLAERVADGGDLCPCCGQRAKIYRRRIHTTLARGLIQLYRHGGAQGFVHAPSLPGDTHEISQLSWWSLIEEERVRRPDGGRAGHWRCTPLGIDYVLNRIRVPKYARVYDGVLRSLDVDELTGIEDALGHRFNYTQLMQGV